MVETHEKLGDFKKVTHNLEVWDKLTIRALHIFIYDEEGEHENNRQRIKNFAGFNYDVTDEKFAEKIKSIKEKLSEPDLVAICAILNIPNNAKDLSTYIFKNLVAGELLKYHDPNQMTEIDLNDYNEDDDDESDSDGGYNCNVPQETGKENVGQEVYFINRNQQRGQKSTNAVAKKYENSVDISQNMEKFVEMVLNRFTFSFKDVEDIIRPFNGSNDFPIEWWVKEFEETANNLKLNDVQKFVFAKKSLKGIAKLFVEAEKGINNWNQLKNILMKEFKTRMSPMKLHDMLKERKKKKNESATEYYLHMKRIAKYSSLEETDLMQYTIDGLPDDRYKIILRGAKSVSHFREKLRDYDVVCDFAENSEANSGNGAENGGKDKEKDNEKDKDKKLSKEITPEKQAHLRCFNCGILGHTVAECKNSPESNCDECNSSHSEQPSTGCESLGRDLNNLLPENFYRLPKKEVTMRGNRMSALVDSGSPLNLINITSYHRIGNPVLNNTGLLLQGFGKAKVLPVGYFEDNIDVDNDTFKTRFYVVSDDVLKTDMIIGNTLLDEAEFIFRKDEIFIRKIRNKEESTESNIGQSFQIEPIIEESESEEVQQPVEQEQEQQQQQEQEQQQQQEQEQEQQQQQEQEQQQQQEQEQQQQQEQEQQQQQEQEQQQQQEQEQQQQQQQEQQQQQQQQQQQPDTDTIMAYIESILAGNYVEIGLEDEELSESVILQRIVDEQEVMINNFQNEIETEKRVTVELQQIIGTLQEEFLKFGQLRTDDLDSWEDQELAAYVKTKLEALQSELEESKKKIQVQHEKLINLNLRLEEKENVIQSYIQKIESLRNDDLDENNSEADQNENNEETAGQNESNEETAGQNESNEEAAGQDENNEEAAGQDENNEEAAGQDENNEEAAGQDENNEEAAGQDEVKIDLVPNLKRASLDTENRESIQINNEEIPDLGLGEIYISPEKRNIVLSNIELILAGNHVEIPPEDEDLYERVMLERVVDEQENMITRFEKEIDTEMKVTQELRRVVRNLEEEFENLSRAYTGEDGFENQPLATEAKNRMEEIQTEIAESRKKLQDQFKKVLDLNVILREKEKLLWHYINKIEFLGSPGGSNYVGRRV